MVAPKFKIKGLPELRRKLKKLAKDVKNPKKFYGAASLMMFQDTMEHFRNEEGSKGKWIQLKPKTILRRREGGAGGFKILQDTGSFRGRIRHEFSNSMAIVGLKDIRATTHQYGRKAIPAREFIWFSKEVTNKIIKRLMIHLKRGLN